MKWLVMLLAIFGALCAIGLYLPKLWQIGFHVGSFHVSVAMIALAVVAWCAYKLKS